MVTLIERDTHHGESDSSAMTAVVAVLAVVAIIGVMMYAFRLFPFAAQNSTPRDTNDVNVTTPDTVNP